MFFYFILFFFSNAAASLCFPTQGRERAQRFLMPPSQAPADSPFWSYCTAAASVWAALPVAAASQTKATRVFAAVV